MMPGMGKRMVKANGAFTNQLFFTLVIKGDRSGRSGVSYAVRN